MTKSEFLYDVGNWSNHRYLLWQALQATTGKVVEFGAGHGSTQYLFQYCVDNVRSFESYENNKKWAESMAKYGTQFITFWESVDVKNCDVLLIDHSPGERRREDIIRFANTAKIIVAHDTEPAADHGYKMRSELAKFRYAVDYKSPGAWASAVSNFIDVGQWQIN